MSGTHKSTYERLISSIKLNGRKYKEFRHKPVRTSEEADAVRPDFSVAQGAKALIIKVRKKERTKEYVMLVVPGDKRFDSKKVKKLLGCSSFSFASPEEVIQITNGVKPGGVPPFGNLFGIKVYVDKLLSSNDEIIFNAGDRRISIAIKYEDYLQLVKPEVVEIV